MWSVQRAPELREMDMHGIDAIYLFAFDTEDTLVVYVDDLVLK